MKAKTKSILYWIATLWLSLGMVSTGIVQLIGIEEETKVVVSQLGYPAYFLVILGIWKLLGVVAILLPGLPLLKEWAYAGFIFAMSGAVASHLFAGGGLIDLFGPTLLILLTVASWYLRPASRRI